MDLCAYSDLNTYESVVAARRFWLGLTFAEFGAYLIAYSLHPTTE